MLWQSRPKCLVFFSVWQQLSLQVHLWVAEQGDQTVHNVQSGHHSSHQPSGFRLHRGWLADFVLVVSIIEFPFRPSRNIWKRRSWGVYQIRRSSRLCSRWSSPRSWFLWRKCGRFTLRLLVINDVRRNFSVKSTREPRRTEEPGNPSSEQLVSLLVGPSLKPPLEPGPIPRVLRTITGAFTM